MNHPERTQVHSENDGGLDCSRAMAESIACVAQLERCMQAGDFKEGLLEEARRLEHLLGELERGDNLPRSSVSVCLAQIYDYHGQYSDSSRVINERGKRAAAELLMSVDLAQAHDNETLKEKILLALYFAQTLYRAEHYTNA